jgi:hypothetical protein
LRVVIAGLRGLLIAIGYFLVGYRIGRIGNAVRNEGGSAKDGHKSALHKSSSIPGKSPSQQQNH